MSYKTQAILARDSGLMLRVAACAATQSIPSPESWAWTNNWALSSQPGWDDAYAYALAQNVENPGESESVISDSMILSAVQAMKTAEAGQVPEPLSPAPLGLK